MFGTLKEIATAVGGKLVGSPHLTIETITTDSRQGGDLFFALIGENFDGHDYLNGKAAVVSREVDYDSYILVDDTKKALGDLAHNHISKFDIPIVAITGSSGKTSTKDMLYSVLEQMGPALKTQGNFNNDIGMPLTIFKMDRSHKIAVLEMGMNHFGEISLLSNIARPTAAVITNIGTAHIGNLGGKDGILKAKLEILEGLQPNSLVILNGDDKLLWGLRGQLPHRVNYYGINNLNCDILAYDVILGSDKSKFKFNGDVFEINALGEHHIYNALASIAAGLEYNVPIAVIQKGVANFRPGEMRQNVFEKDGIKIIEDCYNANTESMIASIKLLKQMGGRGRTIAVLGDMSEMGEFAGSGHKEVGEASREYEIDILITVGQDSKHMKGTHFDNKQDALTHLISVIQKGDTILFKGSRTMKMEELSRELY